MRSSMRSKRPSSRLLAAAPAWAAALGLLLASAGALAQQEVSGPQVGGVRQVTGRVFVADPRPRPYSGTLFLEIYLDASRPAAFTPQELTVVPVAAVEGAIRLPLAPAPRTIRRAFIPERSTPEVNIPVPAIPGAVLGGDLVLVEKRGLRVFRARVVDALTQNPVPLARFLFDDRDHRTLAEAIEQRPDVRPGVPLHTATEAGEIILPTDDEPFKSNESINISVFHPLYLTLTAPARPFLREAARPSGGPPVELALEPGAVLSGRIGPKHAIAGAERPHFRLVPLDGARLNGGSRNGEVRVLLDSGGNFRLTALPPGRYEIKFARGTERVELQPGQALQIEKD